MTFDFAEVGCEDARTQGCAFTCLSKLRLVNDAVRNQNAEVGKAA